VTPPRTLTLNEFAAYCGVNRATVYSWLHSGKAPRAIRRGARIVFRASDIERWETLNVVRPHKVHGLRMVS